MLRNMGTVSTLYTTSLLFSDTLPPMKEEASSSATGLQPPLTSKAAWTSLFFFAFLACFAGKNSGLSLKKLRQIKVDQGKFR